MSVRQLPFVIRHGQHLEIEVGPQLLSGRVELVTGTDTAGNVRRLRLVPSSIELVPLLKDVR